ncbi:hypothetical protein HIM_10703 [Hirsutella minnesotensis 3608]|uniref:DDE-1 domain-containing protein n=1 Tax=Hirsutella minnesotensis 3608 TaxID=1043627 RepID=A0A0F7ZRN4_9HYPO|nr:hypothetical protein HIM_10703 [Hirsutella minnesotensis 3608]
MTGPRWLGIQQPRQSQLNVQYFQKLQKIIEEAGVVPEDIWNMDETGFRIGVGKDQLIVTKRKRSHYFSIPENRESATLIEAISAGGRYTPAFILLAGQNHMAHWYHQQELERETVIRPTPTGYTNDEISLEWIQHFDKHTEICRRGWKRLLILDGHGSHHTKEFIEYCDRHDIIPFGLPPNLTHLLQPLDVVVFQPLKHYHAKALDLMVRDGLTNITKIEFLSCIQDVRKKAFKESTIRSAFKKTGIWPFYPQPVLDCVRSRMAASKTPTPPPPPGPESSPFNTPLTVRQVHKVAWAIEKGLEDVGNVSPELAHDMSRFIKGSLSNVAELLQTKRDLGRTRYAEKIANRRRAMKNKVLQSGGVLTVQEGRAMVRRREQDELDKAREMIGKPFLPAKVIFQGKLHQASWYESGVPDDWHIAVSENGWTSDDLALNWLKEVFDPNTRRRTVGTHRLLILDGHGSHVTPEFDKYCTANSIVVLQMPAHSSHLLQPLDVGCFSPLKTIYGRKVQEKMLAGIHHIDKQDFLPMYLEARRQALSPSNIRSGFMATGLFPFDPNRVLSRLQVQVDKVGNDHGYKNTPSPNKSLEAAKTPYNVNQLTTHAERLLQRRPQNTDSPVSQAINQLIKGCQMAMHSAALLADENRQLRSENQRRKQRKEQRREYIGDGGTLSVAEGTVRIKQRREEEEERVKRRRVEEEERTKRRREKDEERAKRRQEGEERAERRRQENEEWFKLRREKEEERVKKQRAKEDERAKRRREEGERDQRLIEEEAGRL